MTFKSISQTYNDTLITIPKSKLQKAINIIEKSKLMEQEIVEYKSIVDIYKKKIQLSDSIIISYKTKEDNYKKIFYNQEQRSLTDNTIISNQYKLQESTLKKLKKQKLNKWVSLVLGLSLGILISK